MLRSESRKKRRRKILISKHQTSIQRESKRERDREREPVLYENLLLKCHDNHKQTNKQAKNNRKQPEKHLRNIIFWLQMP